MPWVDLGKVVGKDGEIGNVGSTYINNGGDPGVNIVRSGDDGAPDFTFEFENLANDPLSESELEQIVAGQTVSSASVVNGTVLSNFMSALGSAFAAIDHKHDASDIDSGTLAAERIANDSIGTEKFKPAVRDSLSLTSASSDVVQFNLTNERRIRFALYDAPDDGSTGPYLAVNVMSRGEWQTMKRIATW